MASRIGIEKHETTQKKPQRTKRKKQLTSSIENKAKQKKYDQKKNTNGMKRNKTKKCMKVETTNKVAMMC